MILKMLISDSDLNLLTYWEKVFSDISEVNFINSNFHDLIDLPSIDAILLRWIYAQEKYGIIAKRGKSQVIKPNFDNINSKFIVTTPTFCYDDLPKDDEWDNEEWKRVFNAINDFNKFNINTQIETLGVDLSFLYGFRKTKPYNEAYEVKRAFLANK